MYFRHIGQSTEETRARHRHYYILVSMSFLAMDQVLLCIHYVLKGGKVIKMLFTPFKWIQSLPQRLSNVAPAACVYRNRSVEELPRV